MDASMKDLLTVRAGDTVRVPVYFEVSTRVKLRGSVSPEGLLSSLTFGGLGPCWKSGSGGRVPLQTAVS